MINFTFKFDLKDSVEIIPYKNTIGSVRSIRVYEEGTQYKVRYFHNGEAKEVWFFEEELKKNLKTNNQEIGIKP
jgi:hypothetical protein